MENDKIRDIKNWERIIATDAIEKGYIDTEAVEEYDGINPVCFVLTYSNTEAQEFCWILEHLDGNYSTVVMRSSVSGTFEQCIGAFEAEGWGFISIENPDVSKVQQAVYLNRLTTLVEQLSNTFDDLSAHLSLDSGVDLECNDFIKEKFPFEKDFTEQAIDVSAWLGSIKEQIKKDK